MTTTDPKWNHHYVCYAKSCGRTPEEQQSHDEGDPLRNVRFMQWNSGMLKKHREVSPQSYKSVGGDFHSLRDHSAYGTWLSEQVGL